MLFHAMLCYAMLCYTILYSTILYHNEVITLLKDMGKQLEKEAEEDEEIYDKMACWRET